MSEAETGNTVQFLDLLLEFFADGAHWTRGRYHDGHGRHCLLGAIDHLRREHRIPSGDALLYLQEALPPRLRGLVYFNDHHCSGIADLRSLIAKARALALGEAERERAAAGVKCWLLRELERERTAKTTAADVPLMPILSPRPQERPRSYPRAKLIAISGSASSPAKSAWPSPPVMLCG